MRDWTASAALPGVAPTSLGLRSFLGYRLTEDTPVHASMTIIRQRLPEAVFDRVFVFVLSLLEQKGLLRGQAVAVDATPWRPTRR